MRLFLYPKAYLIAGFIVSKPGRIKKQNPLIFSDRQYSFIAILYMRQPPREIEKITTNILISFFLFGSVTIKFFMIPQDVPGQLRLGLIFRVQIRTTCCRCMLLIQHHRTLIREIREFQFRELSSLSQSSHLSLQAELPQFHNSYYSTVTGIPLKSALDISVNIKFSTHQNYLASDLYFLPGFPLSFVVALTFSLGLLRGLSFDFFFAFPLGFLFSFPLFKAGRLFLL